MTKCLGININHDSDTGHLTTKAHNMIDTTLKRINMLNAKSVPTIIGSAVHIEAEENDNKFKS